MKKFGVLFLLSLFAITSCNSNNDDFLNEFAITTYGTNNLTSSVETINNVNTLELYNDDFIDDNGGYISVLNGERITGNNFGTTKIGEHVLYHNNSNYYLFDAFGNETIIPFQNYGDYHVENYNVVMATDSTLFKKIFGEVETYSPQLVVVNFYDILFDGYNYYAFYVQGDTNLVASSILFSNEVNIDETSFSSYEFLSPTCILVHEDDGDLIQYNYRTGNYDDSYPSDIEDTYSTNVERNYIQETGNEVGLSLLSLYFPNTYYEYSYVVNEVDGITNDFTYVLEGKRYKAIIYNGGSIQDENTDYYPLAYRASRDGNKYAVLCKKIGADGVLSNKYYTFILSSDGKRSDFSEDLFLFTEEGLETSVYVSFKNSNKVFDGNEKLLYLDQDLCLSLYGDQSILGYTTDLETYPLLQRVGYDSNEGLVLTFSNLIDGNLVVMYLAKSGLQSYMLYVNLENLKSSISSNNLENYNEFMSEKNIKVSKFLDSSNCVFLNGYGLLNNQGLYFGPTRICAYDEDSDSLKEVSKTIMGKRITSYLVHDNSAKELTIFNAIIE